MEDNKDPQGCFYCCLAAVHVCSGSGGCGKPICVVHSQPYDGGGGWRCQTILTPAAELAVTPASEDDGSPD
jgi:hypothetical protein